MEPHWADTPEGVQRMLVAAQRTLAGEFKDDPPEMLEFARQRLADVNDFIIMGKLRECLRSHTETLRLNGQSLEWRELNAMLLELKERTDALLDMQEPIRSDLVKTALGAQETLKGMMKLL
jgi:hypothetical protein